MRSLMPSVLHSAKSRAKDDEAPTESKREYQTLPVAASEQSMSDEYEPHEDQEGGHQVSRATAIDLCGRSSRTH